MASKKFKAGDLVDKLVFSFFGEIWETGYTVVEPPDDKYPERIYISKSTTSRGKPVILGVSQETYGTPLTIN